MGKSEKHASKKRAEGPSQLASNRNSQKDQHDGLQATDPSAALQLIQQMASLPVTLQGSEAVDFAAVAVTVAAAAAANSPNGPASALAMVSPYRAMLKEVKPLGAGGFGSVVLARNRIDNRLLAIKRVRFKSALPPWLATEDFAEEHKKILREATALASLGDSPHVVKYYSAWIEPDWEKLAPKLLNQDRGTPVALVQLAQHAHNQAPSTEPANLLTHALSSPIQPAIPVSTIPRTSSVQEFPREFPRRQRHNSCTIIELESSPASPPKPTDTTGSPAASTGLPLKRPYHRHFKSSPLVTHPESPSTDSNTSRSPSIYTPSAQSSLNLPARLQERSLPDGAVSEQGRVGMGHLQGGTVTEHGRVGMGVVRDGAVSEQGRVGVKPAYKQTTTGESGADGTGTVDARVGSSSWQMNAAQSGVEHDEGLPGVGDDGRVVESGGGRGEEREEQHSDHGVAVRESWPSVEDASGGGSLREGEGNSHGSGRSTRTSPFALQVQEARSTAQPHALSDPLPHSQHTQSDTGFTPRDQNTQPPPPANVPVTSPISKPAEPAHAVNERAADSKPEAGAEAEAEETMPVSVSTPADDVSPNPVTGTTKSPPRLVIPRHRYSLSRALSPSVSPAVTPSTRSPATTARRAQDPALTNRSLAGLHELDPSTPGSVIYHSSPLSQSTPSSFDLSTLMYGHGGELWHNNDIFIPGLDSPGVRSQGVRSSRGSTIASGDGAIMRRQLSTLPEDVREQGSVGAQSPGLEPAHYSIAQIEHSSEGEHQSEDESQHLGGECVDSGKKVLEAKFSSDLDTISETDRVITICQTDRDNTVCETDRVNTIFETDRAASICETDRGADEDAQYVMVQLDDLPPLLRSESAHVEKLLRKRLGAHGGCMSTGTDSNVNQDAVGDAADRNSCSEGTLTGVIGAAVGTIGADSGDGVGGVGAGAGATSGVCSGMTHGHKNGMTHRHRNISGKEEDVCTYHEQGPAAVDAVPGVVTGAPNSSNSPSLVDSGLSPAAVHSVADADPDLNEDKQSWSSMCSEPVCGDDACKDDPCGDDACAPCQVAKQMSVDSPLKADSQKTRPDSSSSEEGESSSETESSTESASESAPDEDTGTRGLKSDSSAESATEDDSSTRGLESDSTAESATEQGTRTKASESESTAESASSHANSEEDTKTRGLQSDSTSDTSVSSAPPAAAVRHAPAVGAAAASSSSSSADDWSDSQSPSHSGRSLSHSDSSSSASSQGFWQKRPTARKSHRKTVSFNTPGSGSVGSGAHMWQLAVKGQEGGGEHAEVVKGMAAKSALRAADSPRGRSSIAWADRVRVDEFSADADETKVTQTQSSGQMTSSETYSGSGSGSESDSDESESGSGSESGSTSESYSTRSHDGVLQTVGGVHGRALLDRLRGGIKHDRGSPGHLRTQSLVPLNNLMRLSAQHFQPGVGGRSARAGSGSERRGRSKSGRKRGRAAAAGGPGGAVVKQQRLWHYVLYICMEPVLGPALDYWIKERNQSGRVVDGHVEMNLFVQIVRGLRFVHAHGIIHRDMKPANIFLQRLEVSGLATAAGVQPAELWQVRIGDFGLAVPAVRDPEDQVFNSRLQRRASSLSSFPSMPSSNSRALCHTSRVGTATYAAPEQNDKRASYGSEVDIFPLGLILVELLCPFSTGMERGIALQAARNGMLPESMTRSFPTEAALAAACLNPDPLKRPTAAQLLHQLLQTKWVSPSTGTPKPSPGSAPRTQPSSPITHAHPELPPYDDTSRDDPATLSTPGQVVVQEPVTDTEYNTDATDSEAQPACSAGHSTGTSRAWVAGGPTHHPGYFKTPGSASCVTVQEPTTDMSGTDSERPACSQTHTYTPSVPYATAKNGKGGQGSTCGEDGTPSYPAEYGRSPFEIASCGDSYTPGCGSGIDQVECQSVSGTSPPSCVSAFRSAGGTRAVPIVAEPSTDASSTDGGSSSVNMGGRRRSWGGRARDGEWSAVKKKLESGWSEANIVEEVWENSESDAGSMAGCRRVGLEEEDDGDSDCDDASEGKSGAQYERGGTQPDCCLHSHDNTPELNPAPTPPVSSATFVIEDDLPKVADGDVDKASEEDVIFTGAVGSSYEAWFAVHDERVLQSHHGPTGIQSPARAVLNDDASGWKPPIMTSRTVSCPLPSSCLHFWPYPEAEKKSIPRVTSHSWEPGTEPGTLQDTAQGSVSELVEGVPLVEEQQDASPKLVARVRNMQAESADGLRGTAVHLLRDSAGAHETAHRKFPARLGRQRVRQGMHETTQNSDSHTSNHHHSKHHHHHSDQSPRYSQSHQSVQRHHHSRAVHGVERMHHVKQTSPFSSPAYQDESVTVPLQKSSLPSSFPDTLSPHQHPQRHHSSSHQTGDPLCAESSSHHHSLQHHSRQLISDGVLPQQHVKRCGSRTSSPRHHTRKNSTRLADTVGDIGLSDRSRTMSPRHHTRKNSTQLADAVGDIGLSDRSHTSSPRHHTRKNSTRLADAVGNGVQASEREARVEYQGALYTAQELLVLLLDRDKTIQKLQSQLDGAQHR